MSILGSIFGGATKAKASSKAKDALITGAEDGRVAINDAQGQIQSLYAPGVDLYGRATNALSARAGLGGNLGAPGAEPARVSPTREQRIAADESAGYYNSPGTTALAPAGNALSPSAGTQNISPGSYGDLSNPVLSVPDKPVIGATPNVGAAPTVAAPTIGKLDTSLGAFQESPGFQFQLQRGLGAIDSDFAHRGAFNSGAAAKGLTAFATGLANQEYDKWKGDTTAQYNTDRASALGQFNTDRSTALGQFNTDRSSTLGQFNTDRASSLGQFNTDRTYATDRYTGDRDYLTGQYNQQTSDLRSLANGGQNALTATGGSIGAVGNAGAVAAGTIADARAGNALQKGNIWGGVINDVDGQIERAMAGPAGSFSKALVGF